MGRSRMPRSLRVLAAASALFLANGQAAVRAATVSADADTGQPAVTVTAETNFQLAIVTGGTLKCVQNTSSCTFTSPPVPAGHRLEFSAISCFVVGQGGYVGAIQLVGSLPGQYFVLPQGPTGYYAATQPLVLMASAGQKYTIQIAGVVSQTTLGSCTIFGVNQTLK